MDLLENLVLDELKPFFKATKSWQINSIEEIPHLRQFLLEGKTPPVLAGTYANIEITDRIIPGIFGNNVSIRVYTPDTNYTERSLVLFFRGSGFIIGKVWQHDHICAQICKDTNSVVVSVDYRLAPENPYPAAFQDCWSALVWANDARNELGALRDKLAVVGFSAGGGMAVSTALYARDNGGPRIDILCPLYPMLDASNKGQSNQKIINGHVWDGAKNGMGWDAYLSNVEDKEKLDYTAAASLAKNYKDLPPVFSYIGQYDALQDELFDFLRRLTDDGVHVEFHYFAGCFHSFDISWPSAMISKAARKMLCMAINQVFQQQL